MQREKLIAIADALIKLGNEIRTELTQSECNVYYYVAGEITKTTFREWKTDEEVVEYFEHNFGHVGKWWR